MSSVPRGDCGECKCLGFDQSDSNIKMCDCGHKLCFHELLMPAAMDFSPRTTGSATDASTSTPGRSVSELVAPTFELEVNRHLNDHLPSSLPGCEISDLRNWQIDDGSHFEMDTFGYMFKDSLRQGKKMLRTALV